MIRPLGERGRQWRRTAIVAALVLAVVVGWGTYLHARSTPDYRLGAPGAAVDPDPDGLAPMRLLSLEVTDSLSTDRESVPAPAGAVWVAAVVGYDPLPENRVCTLALLADDGRRWSASTPLDVGVSGSRPLTAGCLTPGDDRRSEFLYLVPATAAGSLAGLVHANTGYRGLAPYWVLTPPG
ncbi:MAG: hypothetical protein R2719_12275 [Micropruina sp.]|nr:hypothetical protein [Micropruina sp.]